MKIDVISLAAFLRSIRHAAKLHHIKTYHLQALYLSYISLGCDTDRILTKKSFLYSVDTRNAANCIIVFLKKNGVIDILANNVYRLTDKGKEIVMHIDNEYKRIYNELEAGTGK